MTRVITNIKILLFFILFCHSAGVFAMSIFSKNIMFSEVTGKVTLGGKLVQGAEIEQIYRWSWDSNEVMDKAKTNENGEFRFKQKTKAGGGV